MKKNRRRMSKGFTIMELMVVLALIAMIAVFALPRVGRAVDKGKVTDAVNRLSTISSLVETTCATKSALPTAAKIGEIGLPNGYTKVGTSGNCGNFVHAFEGDGLPKIGIGKTAGQWKFNWDLGDSGMDAEDIPVPAAQKANFTMPSCSVPGGGGGGGGEAS